MQNINQNRGSTIDVPVRILVPSESVGAIIGKGGQTIRQLTQQTRAKVDVFRGDSMSTTNTIQEKVITIRGQPENCINACREILKVMKTDAETKGKPVEIPLKVLAHNDYIGRIIGKQGNIINSIKKDTETTVTVSSINDMTGSVERVITVKGELENMIKALEIIHQKIKSAFENDTKAFGAQAIMMGGIPPLTMPPTPYAPYPPTARFPGQANATPAAAYPSFYPPIFPQFYTPGFVAPPHPASAQHSLTHPPHPSATAAPTAPQTGGGAAAAAVPQNIPSTQPQQQQQQQQQAQAQAPNAQNDYQQYDLETVYLYIPNMAVGAIIGTKGQFIKNIIKMSGASVKITPLSPEETKTANERQVVVTGTRESQYKAQYYIYEKIRQERYGADDNVKLRAEIHVPSQIVGRIIGKNGRNVRDLQRTTGASIKLPEDATQANPVVVRIHGTFNSSQSAQQQIMYLISSGLRGQQNRNQQNIVANNVSGNVQVQNMMVNQAHGGLNNVNTRSTNGNGRKQHRQHQQNGPTHGQQQQQQQPQQQQQSGNNSTNSTPTATTPTNASSTTPTTVQSANTSNTENTTATTPTPAQTTPTTSSGAVAAATTPPQQQQQAASFN